MNCQTCGHSQAVHSAGGDCPRWAVAAIREKRARPRVIVRVGTDLWPDLAGGLAIYFPDGVDLERETVTAYFPARDAWEDVPLFTLSGQTRWTRRATVAECERGRWEIETLLGQKVELTKGLYGRGTK